jgi:hypothetical protein
MRRRVDVRAGNDARVAGERMPNPLEVLPGERWLTREGEDLAAGVRCPAPEVLRPGPPRHRLRDVQLRSSAIEIDGEDVHRREQNSAQASVANVSGGGMKTDRVRLERDRSVVVVLDDVHAREVALHPRLGEGVLRPAPLSGPQKHPRCSPLACGE